MKKSGFLVVSVIVWFLLFVACEGTDVSRLNLEITDPETGFSNENEQGENEGDGKKPPIIEPPDTVNNGEKKSISFQAGAALNHSSSAKDHELFTIVRSMEELNRAAKTRYHQYWTDMGGPYNVYYLAEVTKKYDEDFFAENAIVLYLFRSGYSGGQLDITEVQRQGNVLTIVKDFHQGAATAVSYWTVVIEVSQNDVYGINALESKNDCDCPRFAFDLISVVLTYEATVAAYQTNKTYSPVDFPEFNFSKVENLLTMQPTGPHFRRILFLYLAEQSEENVLRAIELIEQRADVEYAGPDYIVSL